MSSESNFSAPPLPLNCIEVAINDLYEKWHATQQTTTRVSERQQNVIERKKSEIISKSPQDLATIVSASKLLPTID